MKADPLITFRRKPATLDVKSLESFAELLRARVARGREFHCRITGDADLRRWNAQFRGKESTTDVLSFPSDDPASLGDIAISAQRARAQASECGHGIEQEIRILMLHGVLHLMGMDHESDSGQMRRAEARWRRELGLPPGLIERAVS
jgi:probable rRNA maturation factor